MKNFIIIIAVLGLAFTNASLELPHVKSETAPYQKGEHIKYRIHYGWITAGSAEISVKEGLIDTIPTHHIIGTGTTNSAFDWMFKVRDRYESEVAQSDHRPIKFTRRVNEGGYKLKQDYVFDHTSEVVRDSKGDSTEIPENIQDMLSAYYYARTIDFTGVEKGNIFTVKSFVDGKVWPLQIKFIGRETVDVDAGEIKCMKFIPIIQKGRIFKKEEDLVVYISDDENKIPVMAKAKVIVGSIKMELSEYSGLKNPLALAD